MITSKLFRKVEEDKPDFGMMKMRRGRREKYILKKRGELVHLLQFFYYVDCSLPDRLPKMQSTRVRKKISNVCTHVRT